MKISKEDVLEIFNQFSGYTDRSRTEQAIHEVNFECLAEAILDRVYPEHECQYCGIITDEPDEFCYKAPENLYYPVALFSDGRVERLTDEPFSNWEDAKKFGEKFCRVTPIRQQPMFYDWTVLMKDVAKYLEENGHKPINLK
jgi:hypothetical protein